MNVLLWFKRDLRVNDHPALTFAAGLGPVLPVYIVEPDLWAQPDRSARQWDFTAECLEGLRGDLRSLGAPLILRVGEAVSVLDRLCRQNGITAIVSHQETGNQWSYARDLRVAAWARMQGIAWHQLPQSGVTRGQGPHPDFMASPALPPPALSALRGVEPGQMPNARALKLAEDTCRHRQSGGRERGLLLLDSFLTKRAETYRSAMAAPIGAERACSRLSPHLALGTLSAREVAQATAARQSDRPGGAWTGSLRLFQTRLGLRDQTVQQLENRPEIETYPQDPAPQTQRPTESDATRLAAWAQGETGLPFLDATMRYLAATGWLNATQRAMVISAACQCLGLDWRAAGTALARRFTDYDPGLFWPQVQAHSGQHLRPCNPVKQGITMDPSGTFTRRWLPELAPVPDQQLQTPWRWEGAKHLLGRRYPEPLVDVSLGKTAAPAPAQAAGHGKVRPRTAAPLVQLCLDL